MSLSPMLSKLIGSEWQCLAVILLPTALLKSPLPNISSLNKIKFYLKYFKHLKK